MQFLCAKASGIIRSVDSALLAQMQARTHYVWSKRTNL